MSLENINNYESCQRILIALLNDDEEITSSVSEWKFLTTRITNQISSLRKNGIDIETRIVKTENQKKYYGRYVLIKNDENIKRAILLLEELEEKIL